MQTEWVAGASLVDTVGSVGSQRWLEMDCARPLKMLVHRPFLLKNKRRSDCKGGFNLTGNIDPLWVFLGGSLNPLL